ncbi:MAG: FecR domain-containing protein [Myxococcales bacterium]|nr:FecR domain-containing protein [Myxococcales bacterium]
MSRLPRISPDDLRSHADDARVERIWQRVQPELPVRLNRPRSLGRSMMLAAAALSAFGVGLVAGRSTVERSDVETAVVRAPDDAPLADVFAAGSNARSFMLPRGAKLSLEPASLVELVEVADGSITLTLLQGNASVDATTAEGSFFVLAGEARVSAPAGSSMSLARGESDIDVVVASGAVEVFSPAGRHLVKRGQALAHVPTLTKVSERGDIEPAEEPVRVAMVPRQREHGMAAQRQSDPSPTGPADPVVAPAVEPAAPSWLALVSSNKYDEALEVIEKGPGLEATIKNAQSAAELMALSDIAGSKRPALRIRALHRVADDFASDPSAPAAAFYLSRIYEATDKVLAAKYREKTKQAAALNELAICSELKSISTGTDAELAIAVQKASEYLATYPKGSCVEDASSILEDAVSKPKREPEKKTEPEKKPEDKKPEEKKAEPAHPGATAPAGGQAPAAAPSAPSAKASATPAAPPKN